MIFDEAHCSQYGTKARLVDVKDRATKEVVEKKYIFGYANYMRDALRGASFISFIGFTGTPIEKADANTQETFGGYVSIYDIEDAGEDKATEPIYYESRLAKLDINREEIDRLNKDVEEVIEDEEDVSARESTKGKWAELAKLVGAKERVEEIAADLVEHYETRTSVLEGKEGGLVVDYIGIAAELKNALKTYTDAKGKGTPTLKAEKALDVLLEKLDVLRGLFHGFDYSKFEGTPAEVLALLPAAANHILGLGDKNEISGKKRFLDAMAAANVAYSLCSTLDGARELKKELAFLSAISAVLRKHEVVDKKRSAEQKHSALKQILDNAVKAEDVQDIFKMAGLATPNIALLSDAFLEDVRRMEKKNLAVELLERLLQGKIKAQTRTNLVQEKKYSDRLIEALRKYHNRMIESSQVIEEMIQMAKDMQEAMKRHEELGLNLDEEAFYDALADRPEVLLSMGDATLKKLASELTEKLRNSPTVDWQFRDSVRAKMRILIRQLLRKYKYPPEGYEEAIGLVLKQAEALADDWTGER